MRISSSVLLLALAAAPAISAQKPAAPTAYATHQAFQFDGHKHPYTLYRPAHLSASSPAALVIMLRDRSIKGEEPDEHHWNQTADNNGFMVAYPQTRDGAWSGRERPAKHPVRGGDVEYLDTLISHLVTAENADPERIYIAGEGGGAVMAYRMACESTVPLAAIGAVNGVLAADCRTPQPTSVIAIHGAHNQRFPMEGHGLPLDSDYIPSVNASLVAWRAADACTRPVEFNDGGAAVSVSHCAGTRAVARVTLPDAAQQWPVNVPAAGEPARGFDATDALWTFFRNRSAASGMLQASLRTPERTRETRHSSGY